MANELILIVEDDPASLKLLRDLLGVNGYRTIESETAEEGLRLASEHCPSLILMDIQLPGINGIEAFTRLRDDARTRKIPVIAVTASVTLLEQITIKQAGFDGFQSKPISIAQFVQAVREVLARNDGGTPQR
jgi:two-component system cell cycle response regulator DivK